MNDTFRPDYYQGQYSWVSSPVPMWTLQKCAVCDGKGQIVQMSTLCTEKCTFCNGKRAVLVSSWGTVKHVD